MRDFLYGINAHIPTEDLLDHYYSAKEIQNKITTILADKILKKKEFNPQSIQIVLSSFLYEDFCFEDYFHNQYEILRILCLCDIAKKLPKISLIHSNKDYLLAYFLDLLRIIDVASITSFDVADEWMSKYSKCILSYCNKVKIDKDELKKIKEIINESKTRLGDSMAIKLEDSFEELFGLTPEDYDHLCDIALKYSPKNEKLLDLKKWCIENTEEE